jgi:outer membrane receptor for ferrienterochelin and colicin
MKQLNPFVDDADPAKIKAGNPDLLPEDAWAYELGYLKNFNFFNLGFNLFRRDLNNVIQKRISDVSQGVVLERHENVGNAYVQGLEIMTAIQPVSWFNTNLNYSRFGSKLLNEQSGGGALQDQFAWSFKAINDFHIAHWGIFAQIAYNAIGPKKAIQQSENAIQYWDAAISKRMLRDKANISLRVVDVFATNRKIRKERTEAQIRDRIQEAPGQMLSLGFNYQF